MRIVVRVRRAEGDLERLLGVFRRRGWQVTALDARTGAGGSTMIVHATLEGERPPDVLVRQVARLVEVETVHLEDGEPQLARLAGARAKEV